MPSEPTSEAPSEAQVLAAIERALAHRRLPQQPGVLFSVVKDHLELGRHDTRRLRPLWERLHTRGLIEVSTHQSLTLWDLTSAGKRRLTIARRDGPIELPESPQHREWRTAREAGERRIGRLRDELETALDQTRTLLATEPRDSDVWFAASRELQRACYRLGSATYCLFEWAEPNDSEADLPLESQLGRRDYRSWA
ncbi:MAG TPA: hypothetical protein VL988_06370 [Solirubrobacteraceae bacterium]|nr:hypothetical protein [Solirubrobacteraceae bacterium]